MLTYLNADAYRELERTGQLTMLENEDLQINLLGPIALPCKVKGKDVVFQWYMFARKTNHEDFTNIGTLIKEKDSQWLRQYLVDQTVVNSIIIYGSFQESDNPLVRVHSGCQTGDVFKSMRCDCGPQLEMAFEQIVEEGTGAVVYLAGHEGRSIGLWAKGAAYLLQEKGHDTYMANHRLNFPEDCRDFSEAALVLQNFLRKGTGIRLMSNNPHKIKSLEKHELKIVRQVSHAITANQYNEKYLAAKSTKGHLF